MIPVPSQEFYDQEGLLHGARPWARLAFSPYYHPVGLNYGGMDAGGDYLAPGYAETGYFAGNSATFTHITFVAPDELLADYEGFTGGVWQSPVISTRSGHLPNAAVISWVQNNPGFTSVFAWRTAATQAALAALGWTTLTTGQTVNIDQYYQFKWTLEGYRAWAVDNALALTLDGSHYLTAADHADLDAGTGDFNIEMVLKRTLTGQYERLYNKRDVASGIGYDIYIDNNDHPAIFVCDSGGNSTFSFTTLTINDLTAYYYLGISNDRDGNVVCTIKKPGVDAESEEVASARPGSLDNASDLYIGIYGDGVTHPFTGNLSMARFTKSAKTAAAMAAEADYLLAQNSPVLGSATAQWSFQNSLADDSPGAHDLTWQGGGSPAYEIIDDGFLAFAEDSPGELDSYQGYAADVLVAGDTATYLKTLQLLGKYWVPDEHVEKFGTLTIEAGNGFGDLVSGQHSGLTLNNRQLDADGNLAPWFTPGKSSFIFGNELDAQGRPAWYGKTLEVWFGYLLPDTTFTGFKAWEGTVVKWGPPYHGADQSGKLIGHVCDIYARNAIADLFKAKLGLPAADGTPQPVTGGEFLCEAKAISGWSPAPVIRAAYFEQDNFNEIDHIVTAGGGAVTLITPGLPGIQSTSNYALRASINGANQTAQAQISLRTAGEMFIKGNIRFSTLPASPFASLNQQWLQVLDAVGTTMVNLLFDAEGKVYSNIGTQTGSFNVLAFEGVSIPFALSVKSNYVRLWLNGDEVINSPGSIGAVQTLVIGAKTGAVSETWVIDYDDIEIRDQFYENAFKVEGGPFDDIGAVYVDNIAIPPTQTSGGYTQTLTRYPDWGLVQFTSTDPNYKTPSGTLLMRVIKDAGGVHAADFLQTLIGLIPNPPTIDTASFAAVKAAKPLDIINFRLGDSGAFAVADAVKEICSRCLYWLVADQDEVRLFAYTGQLPGEPVYTLTDANIASVQPITDLDSICEGVSAIFGWNERDPSLYENTGDINGENVQQLDYTWKSPVCMENRAAVRANVSLFMQSLAAQERWDPVTTSLKGARLELFDPVGIDIAASVDTVTRTRATRKEINLDRGGSPLERVTGQLLRFLGDN